MRHKTVAIIRIALLVSLGYLPGVQSAKADDPPASPVEVPQGWQRLGPYGGKVVDVAYAPSDPNIVYALLDNETVPVYKSIDNGKTWNFLSVPFDVFVPCRIAVSPADSDIVLFTDSDRLFRTSDGGLNWTSLDVRGVYSIKFSSMNPQKVYSATENFQFLRSNDSGINWEVATDLYIGEFFLDPSNSSRILSTRHGDNASEAQRGLFVSNDDGASWSILGFENQMIISVGFGNAPGTVYLVKLNSNEIWKSTDNGSAWSVMTDTFASHIIDFDVIHEPSDQFFVTVKDFGEPFYSNIWKSNDGGGTWVHVPSRWAYILYENVAVDPSNTNRFIGYQKWFGMHFTWDAGATWTQSGSVFPGIALQHAGISPITEGLILVQTRDGYNLRSLDAGKTWEFSNLRNEGSGGFGFSFSHNNAQSVYWLYGSKLYRSQNSGLDWQEITPEGFIYPCSIAVHPSNDAIVLCGNQRGVINRSTDGGNSWTETYNASNVDVSPMFIRYKPLDPSIVYAATENWMTSVIKLLRSTDSGATWVEVSRIPTMYLEDLAISYTDPEIIYESTGQGLYRSVNQGVDWERMGQDIGLQSSMCLTSQRNPQWVWIAGRHFYLSTDTGITWDYSSTPYLYDDATIDYPATSVMGPSWMPKLFFASQVDGIWTRVEDMPPRIMMAGSNYDASASMLHFNAWVSDAKGPEDIDSVEILYEGNELGVRLHDDGTHGDLNADDGLFSLSIPADVNDPIINITYSLIAKDKNGLVSRSWPELTTTNFRGEQLR